MKAIKVSKYTKEQAEEYANNEADIHGFPRGSYRWKKALSEYLHESYHTMAVGRNPRPGSHRYKAFIAKYPEIFGADGFAGRVSKEYRTSSGSKGIPLEEAQNRIMSTVMNIVKLFENGIVGTMNTTVGRKQGKISNRDMSELQMPNKEEFSSPEEFEAAKKDVVYAWFQRDILVDAVLELLIPFFNMESDDVDHILGAISLEDTTADQAMGEGRMQLIDALRQVMKPKFSDLNYANMLLKK